MDTSFKQSNKPNSEFTRVIIDILRNSDEAISATTLCMAMKEKLPKNFHPVKGDFNKWMKCLYNIETDNSNTNMPYYKFKMNNKFEFLKKKYNENSYIKILLDKIQNEHIKWSKMNELYTTTHHNQSTWDNLNDIFNSLSQNIKTFDEKFPNYSIIINEFRINKMPNKDNIENVSVKELNYSSALGGTPPGLLQSNERKHNILTTNNYQQINQTPRKYQTPVRQISPAYQTPAYQKPAYQTSVHQITPGYQTPAYQTSPVHQIPPVYQIPHNFQTSNVNQSNQLFPKQPSYNPLSTQQINPTSSIHTPQLNFFDTLTDQHKQHIDVDNLFGLELYPNNNFNEIIKQLSQEELAFLDNIHNAFKNIKSSALCKLIKEIGKARNIVFS